MATQDEARQAIIDEIADRVKQVGTAEAVLQLAQAYDIVKKNEQRVPKQLR
ncbi:hypothetical protein HMPREF0063_11925 [Aeromicrobium marinum DSM 15272]|uniref:Uncharacterized protein n=1 Tax=Aeromicrobium marinum DSM 15272 TaxID=585531 RepID=E2SDY9_9ACTN|nr:hypothetical protein [Aeromicrobium marinum]EFQ82716.1 hypothetical protein HMPREF0063_11925 [Aeromicrobium marinum DSM 15272]